MAEFPDGLTAQISETGGEISASIDETNRRACFAPPVEVLINELLLF